MTKDTTRLFSRVKALVERGERISMDDCESLLVQTDLIGLASLARVPRERRFGRSAFALGVPVVDYYPGLVSVARGDADGGDYNPGALLRLATARGIDVNDLIRVLQGASCAIMLPASSFHRAHRADTIRLLETIADRSAGCSALITDIHQCNSDMPAGAIEDWKETHEEAHEHGISSIAVVSYGPTEDAMAIASRLELIRSVQDRTGGFIGISLHAQDNDQAVDSYKRAPAALETLRLSAVTRLYLDNVSHLMIAPRLVGAEVAVLALSYGIDAIDDWTTGPDLDPEEGLGGVATEARATRSAHVRDRLIEARWREVSVDGSFNPMPSSVFTR